MNPEQIAQVVETIKTLNLNIDSTTAVEIVNIIMPYMYLTLLKDIIITITIIILFNISLYYIIRVIKDL